MRIKDEPAQISELVQRLTTTFAEVPAGDVAITVNEALSRFDGSPIREFVPLFVERRARAVLAQRELAHAGA